MRLLHLFRAATATPKTKSGLKRLAGAKFWAASFGAAALTLMGASAQAASFAGLGGLPGGSFSSSALGVSADGSVVVGSSSGTNGTEAFRWTVTDGMVGLGDLPGGSFGSQANAVSADGSVVVGSGSGTNGFEAFRWTEADGIVGLGDLPGGDFSSQANGVSADGSVVVGSSSGTNGTEAFRWTVTDGIVGLDDLPGGSFGSQANAASADGSVIAGSHANTNHIQKAFRWTAVDGIVRLDIPSGHGYSVSQANAISADGSVVVGWIDIFANAFIWDSTNGTRILSDVLTNDFGLDLTGWSLYSANGISADGLTIVGSGMNPNGREEAWIAQLDPIPGSSQENPILPERFELIGGHQFVFNNVPRGFWYDPPAAFGFEYTMLSDSLFTQILDFPVGIDTDDLFTVTVGDNVLGEFGPGQSVDFVSLLGGGVSSFTVTGIDPLVDGSDPTAFPIRLDFNTETASFEMRALTASTPEPSVLIGLGTLALTTGALLKRKRQA